MDEAKCIKLLEEHGVKPTANRIVVVKALASSIQPQSLAELESRIETIDKSNVFRALTLFREHHLVHAIEGLTNSESVWLANHILSSDTYNTFSGLSFPKDSLMCWRTRVVLPTPRAPLMAISQLSQLILSCK